MSLLNTLKNAQKYVIGWNKQELSSTRLIGEESDISSTFAPKYNPEQIDWMKKYWGLNVTDKKKKKKKRKTIRFSIGRPCCGAREMS